METDTRSNGTMAMQRDDPSLQHVDGMIDRSETMDQSGDQTQTDSTGDSQLEMLLELTSCLLSLQAVSPETALEPEVLKLIEQLDPTAESQELKGYDVLRLLKHRIDSLWHAQPICIAPLFQHLANLCRDEEWRTPLGEIGLLQNAIDVLTKETPTADAADDPSWVNLQRQTLRLVGNLCADIDENRQRVLQYQGLQAILTKFKDKQLADIAVPAAFNICNDYEAARQIAMHSNLFEYCLMLLEDGILKATPAFSYLCLMLDIVHDKVDIDNTPSNGLDTLLKASLDGDLEIAERLSLVHLINKLLASETNQKRLIHDDKVDLVLGSLFRTFSEGKDPMEAVLSGRGQTKSEDFDEEQDLWTSRNNLVALLSDISTHPEFVERYEIFTGTSMIVWNLRYVMLSPLVPISQASCLMLGNLACSDDICIRMVKEVGIHEAASLIVKGTACMQLLHSALGLLRNLAVPADNKESLAMVGVIENAQKCLIGDYNPQIQLAAASLMRQMINGSMANIQRLLLMSSYVEDETSSMQTRLAILLRVYEKTNEIAIKTEIARAVIAVLRCVYGKDVDPLMRSAILVDLYSRHAHLVQPVMDMVIQSQYPVVRSEGWFALGVMSRDAAGREMIMKKGIAPNLYKLLEGTIRGRIGGDEHEQENAAAEEATELPVSNKPADAMTKDRDNALVLVYELSKIEDPSILDRSVKEQLMQLLEGKHEDSSHT